MPKFPWWVWVIILLVVIGLFPGFYHLVLTGLGNGFHTVCPQCTSQG